MLWFTTTLGTAQCPFQLRVLGALKRKDIDGRSSIQPPVSSQ